MRQVIIGAGPAGLVIAEAIRRRVPSADVVLINGEPEPPYARMALPYFLAGDLDEAGLRLRRDHAHLDSLEIDLRQAQVEEIDPNNRRLTLSDGERLAYDRLAVATGSRPKRPPFDGLDQDGVTTCWTLADARRIAEVARPGAKVVQLGAGFVASIIMRALIRRGVSLEVITGSSGRMVRSMLCPSGGALLRSWCEGQGVAVRSGERVDRLEPGPVVVLEGGERLAADLVVIATGVEANAELLAAAGAEVDRGAIVDDHLRTTLPDVWAAGDVAQGRAFGRDELEVHPIQPAAVEHGRAVGLNMAGADLSYPGNLSLNVLDAMGLVSCSYGDWRADEGAREVAEGIDLERHRMLRLVFDDDLLVGVNAVGVDQHLGALRGLIQREAPLGRWKEALRRDPFCFAEAFVSMATR